MRCRHAGGLPWRAQPAASAAMFSTCSTVVAISRPAGVDVITRAGLVEALDGVEGMIDTATGPSPEQQAATEFFTTAARNLQELGERAGAQRIVVVSIIGCDRFAGGYNAAKAAMSETSSRGPSRRTSCARRSFTSSSAR
jgi:uncharacterized protein YbjT (DUF2867 family)